MEEDAKRNDEARDVVMLVVFHVVMRCLMWSLCGV